MKHKSWIVALLSILLSVCLAFLGLFGALELTLFSPGNLIQCMDQVGYAEDISNVVQAACQGYVMSAGLNTVALEGYLNPEDTGSEVHRAVAERYRGSETAFYQAHFPDLAERAQALLSPEELERETPDSLARFYLLQDLCENAFREITRPPFDAALSCVLQYRACRLWAYLVLLVLGVSVSLVLRRAVPDRQIFGRRVMQSLCGGGLALAVLGALLRWALPFASWMPKENLSYPLFCMWWSGFALTTALAGLLMLAAGLVWAVWSGTRPVKKTGGSKDKNSLLSGGHDGPLSDTGGFSGDDRMNAPAIGRTIDLSRALVGSALSSDAATVPAPSDFPDDSGSFPGL